MLSKSQAKSFFLMGTFAFTAIFVGLTVDTFKRIPAQTKTAELSATAIKGKHLFESKNCMGCHTILGEGAYYAPELTKVYERRGEAFIKAMLKNPEQLYPGQRKMTNYHLSDEEIEGLVAFLKWIGNIDLNGFPPKPDLIKVASPISQDTSQKTLVETVGRPQVFNQMCVACHALKGQGGSIGPALDDIGTKRDIDYLNKWLKNPASIKSDAKMPQLPLSDQEIVELSAFLSQLKGE